MCQEHWAKLRVEIDKQGVGDQVSLDAAGVIARLKSGRGDPLINANAALMRITIQTLGEKVDRGETCPVCELEQHDWVGAAAAGAAMEFKNVN